VNERNRIGVVGSGFIAKGFHLCHLEIARTVRRCLDGGSALLTNGASPTVSVAAIAKRPLSPGETIIQACGSFDARGIAVRIAENPNHVPIGLLANAVVARRIEPGQQITFADVELPESLALQVWQDTVGRAAPAPLGAH
jgi:predicted homoserine dehydrogenase-like protein